MALCRQPGNPMIEADCEACLYQMHLPHSCGHRSCPHCQHHESQQWLERQLKKVVPAHYFLITFTLPRELRSLAWGYQRIVYDTLIQTAWDTLKTFSQNDKQLKGIPGAIAVLHTHARNLDFHPHVHVVIPAGAIDKRQGVWRTKRTNHKRKYLFNHTALANVFRAKMLEAISEQDLTLPDRMPSKWVVDCKAVGSGEHALTYLGKYLYRGVLPEKNIITVNKKTVTYRYQESKTKKWRYKTLSGAEFLWKRLQHVLPKRFRRTRNYGFLHPNSKRLIQVIQLRFSIDPNRFKIHQREKPKLTCPCCGGNMHFTAFRIPPNDPRLTTKRFIGGQSLVM